MLRMHPSSVDGCIVNMRKAPWITHDELPAALIRAANEEQDSSVCVFACFQTLYSMSVLFVRVCVAFKIITTSH